MPLNIIYSNLRGVSSSLYHTTDKVEWIYPSVSIDDKNLSVIHETAWHNTLKVLYEAVPLHLIGIKTRSYL